MNPSNRNRNTWRMASAVALATMLGTTACSHVRMHPLEEMPIATEEQEEALTEAEVTASEHFDASPNSAQGDLSPATSEGLDPIIQNWANAETATHHESAIKQRVWIVDVPARSETVHHAADGYWTEGGYYTMCTICGQEITESPMAHMDSTHPTAITGSWTDVSRPSVWIELSPAWDELVSVPEQGHWEYR